VHIHFGLTHGIPHGFDPLVGLFANDHLLGFAGALFDNWLLVPLGDLEYPFLHGADVTANSAGRGAPFDDDALVLELHLLFRRGLDDISAKAITPLGCPFADGQLLFHGWDDLFSLLACPRGSGPHLIGSRSGVVTALYLWANPCRPANAWARLVMEIEGITLLQNVCHLLALGVTADEH
jgi:hypothetical protein